MAKFSRLLATSASKASILIRLMVGLVFLSEGIQKFLFPEQRGVGRFRDLDMPFPDFTGYFVGFFETLCGALVVLGLFTRLASIPLIVIMLVALSVTKFPILADEGFWKMAHDMRTDFAMLMGSIYLFIRGGGKLSVDEQIAKRRNRYRYY